MAELVELTPFSRLPFLQIHIVKELKVEKLEEYEAALKSLTPSQKAEFFSHMAEILRSKVGVNTEQVVEVLETSPIIDNDEFTLSEREQALVDSHRRREEHRLQNYGRSELVRVSAYWDELSRMWRAVARLTSSTGLRGLIWHLAQAGTLGGPEIHPSIVHLQNDVKDAGRKITLSDAMVDSFVLPAKDRAGLPVNATAWLSVKESHLINMKLVKLLAFTFPKAGDFRAYVSGLCAPGTFFPNSEVHFREQKSWKQYVDSNYCLQYLLNSRGERRAVDAGADGNGVIHPQHWLIKKLGITTYGCSIQIRCWDPVTGMFLKGIFVVDEEAMVDGKPAIIANSSFVKGRLKGTKLPDSMSLPMTVIQVWDRPHHKDESRWSFEVLQNFMLNDETKAGVTACLRHHMARFKASGGMARYVRMATREDDSLHYMAELCKKVGVDPMSSKDVANVAFTHMERDQYTFLQGASVKSPTFTMVLDNGVPAMTKDREGVMRPVIAIEQELHVERGVAKVTTTNFKKFIAEANLNGRVTTRSVGYWRKRLHKLNPDWDGDLVEGSVMVVERLEDVYLPGDLVLCPRYPMVTQQNLVFAVVVKPLTGVLKASGRLAARTMRANELLITLYQMGDADGDRCMVEGRQRILSWAKPANKLRNVHGGEEILYMLEPSKLDSAKDPKAKITVIGSKGGLSKAAYHIIAREGGGPVGPLTYMHAMFVHLAAQAYDERHEQFFLQRALAVAILIQEAIDSMKRFVRYTNPVFASKASNWIEVHTNVYALPKEDPERFLPDNSAWYEGNGTMRELNMSTVRNWAYGEVEKIYPELKQHRNSRGNRTWNAEKVTSWRRSATSSKRVDPRNWKTYDPVCGTDNLVTFCAKEAKEIWDEEEGQAMLELADFDVLALLKKALPDTFCWKPISAEAQKKLLVKSGLLKYSEALGSLRNLEFEQRHERRELARAELAAAMSLMTSQEIVNIISTEVAINDDSVRDRTLNRVFRAACMPGSPLLETLGLEKGGKCTFVTDKPTGSESRADRMVKWMVGEMKRRQETGEAVTLFQVAQEVTGRVRVSPDLAKRWAALGLHLDTDPEKPSKHMAATGMAIKKCRHCCEQIDAAVRRHYSSNKTLANRRLVLNRVTSVNQAVKQVPLPLEPPENWR